MFGETACLARRVEEREFKAASVCPYNWLSSLFVITTWVCIGTTDSTNKRKHVMSHCSPCEQMTKSDGNYKELPINIAGTQIFTCLPTPSISNLCTSKATWKLPGWRRLLVSSRNASCCFTGAVGLGIAPTTLFDWMFIGPECDHCLPLSVTNWLTHSLTHSLPFSKLYSLTDSLTAI